jgi:hypothetical protein
MFLNQNNIVEKICEIPVTPGDISESIFDGVNTKNGMLHRLAFSEEGGFDHFELIPKLKISSLNSVFLIINRISDHEKQF